jgi:hypothetical protein
MYSFLMALSFTELICLIISVYIVSFAGFYLYGLYWEGKRDKELGNMR